MTLLSKKELINQYNEGRLNDFAYYQLSAFNGLMIVDIDDENVFGYHQYMSDEKQFFKVKLYQNGKYTYIKIQNKVYDLDNFMRIR
jgi:cytochrome b involved in lipid metabolism